MAWVQAIVEGAKATLSAVNGIVEARRQQKAWAKNAINNVNSTMRNYANQTNQMNLRYTQEVASAQQEQQQTYLQNLQSKATAQASAAGSGVAGNSIDNLFRNYDRATNLSNYIAETNIRNMGLQFNEDLKGLRANAQSSINSIGSYTGQTGFGAVLSAFGR